MDPSKTSTNVRTNVDGVKKITLKNRPSNNLDSTQRIRLAEYKKLIGSPVLRENLQYYMSFAVGIAPRHEIVFEVGKVYTVKTPLLNCSVVGFARLEDVWMNVSTRECYGQFQLYHLPEDTEQGQQPWQHGEDELYEFYNRLIIRCSDMPKWYDKTNKFRHGTRSFERSEISFATVGESQISLVRFKTQTSDEVMGAYSISADNECLMELFRINGNDVVFSDPVEPKEVAGKGNPIQMNLQVLCFQDYCFFKKNKQGIENGLIMKENDAIESKVIPPANEMPSRIFFSRSTFKKPQMARSSLFATANRCLSVLKVKGGKKSMKCGKKRIRRKIHAGVSEGLIIDDNKHFKEDGSRLVLERKFLLRNGSQAKEDTHTPCNKKVKVEINDKPLSEFIDEKNVKDKDDPVEKMMLSLHKWYNDELKEKEQWDRRAAKAKKEMEGKRKKEGGQRKQKEEDSEETNGENTSKMRGRNT